MTTTINGTDNNDALTGDASNNIINGGAGADTMRGGLGDDVYIVDGLILNKYDGYMRKWVVEYDGRQHIEIVEYWGGLDDFIIRAKCDAIKNKYCEDNEMSLIRIPHMVKTQEEIDSYLEDKFYNSTFEELVEHNKNLEKKQQQVIRGYKNKLEELAKKELKEVIHILKF